MRVILIDHVDALRFWMAPVEAKGGGSSMDQMDIPDELWERFWRSYTEMTAIQEEFSGLKRSHDIRSLAARGVQSVMTGPKDEQRT